jgi:hypothetical protein
MAGASRAAGVAVAWFAAGGWIAELPASQGGVDEARGGPADDITRTSGGTRAAWPPPDDDGRHRCDTTALPRCEGPFTGATCTLPCVGEAGSNTETCGLDVYCHADGTVYGLATRNAVLYAGSPDASDDEIEAAWVAWVAEHEAELGLDEGMEPQHVELELMPDAASSARPLRIVRFKQSHRGFPVLAPDDVITVVYAPQGVVSISGAIVDGRASYAHEAMQASAAMAALSMRRHASMSTGVALEELEVVHGRRVAVPAARAIGWAGVVQRRGGSALARAAGAGHRAQEPLRLEVPARDRGRGAVLLVGRDRDPQRGRPGGLHLHGDPLRDRARRGTAAVGVRGTTRRGLSSGRYQMG